MSKQVTTNQTAQLQIGADAVPDIISCARLAFAEGFDASPSSLDGFDVLYAQWRRGGAARETWLESNPQNQLGWHVSMIERGLDLFAERLRPEAIIGRLQLQLGNTALLEGFQSTGSSELRAVPLGVVLHVVSDNIFFGAAEALLAGLVTGNVNIVKKPSVDGGFLDHFVESLRQTLPHYAPRVIVLSWRGGNAEIEGKLAQNVDGILVAGSASTIRAYRTMAPATTDLIEFGPRYSIAVITEGSAETVSFKALAEDVALWEQSACTSVQCVFVEGEANAMSVAERLFDALSALAKELPEGGVSLAERLAVAGFRERAKLRLGSSSKGKAWFADGGSTASVVFDDSNEIHPSPLRRCVWVKPFSNLSALQRELAYVRGTLQSVALSVAPQEEKIYQGAMLRCGARRICQVGAIGQPGSAIAHDGMQELTRLVRFVGREVKNG